MRRASRGFTLLEVVMAGAILLMGMALMAQLTRSVLDSTVQGAATAVQDSTAIDRFMQSQVALVKSYRNNALGYVDNVPYGKGFLQIRQPMLQSLVVPGASGFSLTRYEIFVELVVPGQANEVVGHTWFWKLGSDDGTIKTGI